MMPRGTIPAALAAIDARRPALAAPERAGLSHGALMKQIEATVARLNALGLLLDHPAVAQAVTFALPHDKLGEEVAAAVVLKEGAAAGDRELRDFVAGRLADFKVPRKIVFLPEIPKGATGKLQRIGLAKVLGLSA